MATPLSELIKVRKEKLEKLASLGVIASAYRFDKTHTIATARESLDKEVQTAGRITAFRSHGKLAFADLTDQSGKIQVLFTNLELSEKVYKIVRLLDIGD